AVVGEFVVGPGGDKTGLASTILESSFRLDIAKMFAALALISATGITAYLATHALSQLLLGAWHESAVRRDA
ncbi:MAG: ABC transporter permease, partial [Planctomycetota bacterium]